MHSEFSRNEKRFQNATDDRGLTLIEDQQQNEFANDSVHRRMMSDKVCHLIWSVSAADKIRIALTLSRRSWLVRLTSDPPLFRHQMPTRRYACLQIRARHFAGDKSTKAFGKFETAPWRHIGVVRLGARAATAADGRRTRSLTCELPRDDSLHGHADFVTSTKSSKTYK